MSILSDLVPQHSIIRRKGWFLVLSHRYVATAQYPTTAQYNIPPQHSIIRRKGWSLVLSLVLSHRYVAIYSNMNVYISYKNIHITKYKLRAWHLSTFGIDLYKSSLIWQVFKPKCNTTVYISTNILNNRPSKACISIYNSSGKEIQLISYTL